jgi:hypothetical protein
VAELEEVKRSADPKSAPARDVQRKEDNLHHFIFYKLQLGLEADFKFELLPLHSP